MVSGALPPITPPPPARGTAHLDVHVPVELRDGRARQPAPQVEPVAVLRHHVLHLRGQAALGRRAGAAAGSGAAGRAQSPQIRGNSDLHGASKAKPEKQLVPAGLRRPTPNSSEVRGAAWRSTSAPPLPLERKPVG